MRGRIGQLVELTLCGVQRLSRHRGRGVSNAFVAEKTLQIGDVHAQREQLGRHRVAQ